MHLEPGRVIGQQRVGGGVRLVKAVARKLLHVVENFVGLLFRKAVDRCTVPENLAVLGHFFGFFLAHGAAQHVGTTQRIAAQDLRHLHDLFLVHHHAIGVLQDALDARVGVFHRLAAHLARHVSGDQVHGAGPV